MLFSMAILFIAFLIRRIKLISFYEDGCNWEGNMLYCGALKPINVESPEFL